MKTDEKGGSEFRQGFKNFKMNVKVERKTKMTLIVSDSGRITPWSTRFNRGRDEK